MDTLLDSQVELENHGICNIPLLDEKNVVSYQIPFNTTLDSSSGKANNSSSQHLTSPDRDKADMIWVSNSILAELREQISLSLKQTKNLEDKAKLVPLLQVQLSVLKEEKRLLQIQLKSKIEKPSLKSVGVGDCITNFGNDQITQLSAKGVITPPYARKFFSFEPPTHKNSIHSSKSSPSAASNSNTISLKKDIVGLKSFIEFRKINMSQRSRAESCPPKFNEDCKMFVSIACQTVNTLKSSNSISVPFPDVLPHKCEREILQDMTKESLIFCKCLKEKVNICTQTCIEMKSQSTQIEKSQNTVSTDTEGLILNQDNPSQTEIDHQTLDSSPHLTDNQKDDTDYSISSIYLSDLEKDSYSNSLNDADSFEHPIEENSSSISLTNFPDSREQYELNPEVLVWCRIVNDHILNPSNSCSNFASTEEKLRKAWFQITGNRDSSFQFVEECLNIFEDISAPLLKHIVNMKDSNGNTVLHYAVSYGNYDIINVLLDTKIFDINVQNKAGYTCIMLAAISEVRDNVHHEILMRLLNQSNINFKALHNGQTALMLASSHGHLATVRLMLEAGSYINLQDEDGSSALMCAAEHNHLDIVRELLAHPDCDPYLMDNDGSTALNIAMQAGHKDIGVLIYAQTSLKMRSHSLPLMNCHKKRNPKLGLTMSLS